MIRSRVFSCFVFAVICLGGCNFDTKENRKAVDDISKQIEKLTNTVSDYVQHTDVPGEVQKLQQFEYEVFMLPVATTPADLRSQLNEFGKARWDCFHVERIAHEGGKDELLILCKRRPDTPLKFIPKTFAPNS